MNRRIAASVLALSIAACGDHGRRDTPDAGAPDAGAPDADATPDAQPISYTILYTRWVYSTGPELVAGSLDGHVTTLRALEGGVVGASQASLSPDGAHVAFASFDTAAGSWALIVRPLQGKPSEEVVVAHTTGTATPSWSPDGARLAYVDFVTDFTYGVFVVGAHGGPIVEIDTITADAEESACIRPQWSPDGTEVAYSTLSGIRSFGISDHAVHDLVPLKSASWTCEPRWSPDGQRLAFTWGPQDHENGKIVRIARDGSDQVTLAPADGGMGIGQVRWSPDGSRLAFIDFDQTANDAALRVVAATGGTPTVLDHLHAGIIAGHPAWSSDGTTLLYVRFDDALGARLATVPTAGGARTDLPLFGASIAGAYPSWLATPIVMN